MWKELFLNFQKTNDFVKMNPPATDEDIEEVEKRLRVKIPVELKRLLMELNGDSNFILSTKEIINVNSDLRKIKGYKLLDRILFVATNGCGDYLGYPVDSIGNEKIIKQKLILMWDHETDNQEFKANSLKEAIELYYNNLIY